MQLTESENGYFIACTDIFHDSPYTVIGRPSVGTQLQNTVVMNLETTITQSSFPGLVPADNWSCNIVSYPFLTSKSFISTVDNGYFVTPSTPSTNAKWGGVVAYGSAVGASTIIPASNYVSLNGDKFFYPEYTGAADNHNNRIFYEVLSIGMEIINATPELYKSGNVTRYRVPTQGRATNVELLLTNGTDPRFSPEVFVYPLPPTTEALATQYPDSVIDEAQAGSYQMHTLQDQVSDFYCSNNSIIHIVNPSPPSAGFNGWTARQPFSTTQIYDAPMVRGDFDIIGSYFTGLSPQTILKIRYRAIVSLVPSSTDSKLVSLAKASPPPNPALDLLIHQVQSTFSPGIPASMNASGDWWKTVLKGVSKVAKPIGSALGGDAGAAIGGGVAAVADSILGKKKSKKPKKENLSTALKNANSATKKPAAPKRGT